MSHLRQKFAQRLKALRREKAITQEELAQATGLSVSFVRALEQGINAPSFESLDILANSLNVDVKDLFYFESER